MLSSARARSADSPLLARNPRGSGLRDVYSRRLARAVFALYRVFLSPAFHRFSQLIGAPDLGCRFEPTCSRYAEDAFLQFGFRRGLLLALRRLARCHPFSSGGADPLPCQTVDIRSS